MTTSGPARRGRLPQHQTCSVLQALARGALCVCVCWWGYGAPCLRPAPSQEPCTAGPGSAQAPTCWISVGLSWPGDQEAEVAAPLGLLRCCHSLAVVWRGVHMWPSCGSHGKACDTQQVLVSWSNSTPEPSTPLTPRKSRRNTHTDAAAWKAGVSAAPTAFPSFPPTYPQAPCVSPPSPFQAPPPLPPSSLQLLCLQPHPCSLLSAHCPSHGQAPSILLWRGTAVTRSAPPSRSLPEDEGRQHAPD